MRNYALHQARQTEAPSIATLLHRLLQNWKARREIAHLSRFDDHMLRDIGLTRQSLRTAMNVSLSDDPYALLETRRR